MSRYVNIEQRVTATYYDEEHEEWSQKTVTVEDVLDSVCEDYDIVDVCQGYWVFDDPLRADFMCSECLERNDICTRFCPSCGAIMDLEGGCR